MKTLTFYAFLLIATFVSTTKPVCYSDVAQSLLELHSDRDVISARLNQVNEGFRSSHRSLEKVKSVVVSACARLNKDNTADLNARKNKILYYQQRKVQIIANNVALAADNAKVLVGLKTERARRNQVKAELANGTKDLRQKQNELLETINVLKRLRNFAQDELFGTSKASTKMGEYNVVSKNGVAFIEKSNFNQEMRSLMAKSETASKSLITTLLFMVQAKYTDPKLLKKVLNLLTRIIQSNYLKRRTLGVQFKNTTTLKSQMLEASRSIIQNLKESNVRNIFHIALNKREINTVEAELVFLNRSLQRKTRDTQFQSNFCAKQNAMMDKYARRYTKVTQRLIHLRSLAN
jgi:hypothetical protein